MVSQTIVVIPCYNEERRLDVAALAGFLEQNPAVGLLLVNDGSSDGTLRVLEELRGRCPQSVEVLDLAQNGGKGEAIRAGIQWACQREGCERVAFWDADLATPLAQILDFERLLRERAELQAIIGARVQLLGRQIERRLLRHYLGRLFATNVSLFLGIRVYDTQCGAKMFRNTALVRQIFTEPFLSRWIFDVEILLRYKALHGSLAGIYEYPLPVWRDVGGSKVKSTDFLKAIRDLALIRRKMKP